MSIMRQMKDKAVAMAEAMAQRARTPQDIEAVRQRLVADIQGGRMPAYVGIPLVQDLTQRLTKAKAEMAQQVAGMGVPQAPQGAPLAQQVMAQAQQAPAGVESLPSNLPQSYAPGGLVAFEEGGKVERYQNTGLVDTTPAGRFFSGLGQNFSETNEAAKLRNQLQAKYGPASALPGLFMKQTDEQRQQAKQIAQLLPNLSLPQLKLLNEQGPAALPSLRSSTPTDLGPVPGTSDTSGILGGKLRYADAPDYKSTGAPTAAPAAAPGVAMPKLTLPTFTPTAMPKATDLSAIVKGLPDEAKSAFETARTKEEEYLRGITEPGEKAREKKFSARDAALEKGTAMDRALNTILLGLKVAGSKERTLAGALGNEGAAGIQALIQGEAANRVAKERLEDARDNFEQQKIAMRKGDRAAATAAGQRAADDVRAYGQLTFQAAQAGDAQAIQRYQAENTVGFQGAQLQQQGVLGLAQLQQQANATNAQLQLGRERLQLFKDQIAAGNKRAQAALATAEQKAYVAFQNSPTFRQAQEQAKKMAPIEAQRFMQQEWLKYSANAIPSLLGSSDMGIPSFNDMYKATE